jgi:glycosyltransferase A (GT-A) superfamily protein (DUF2064 family)
VSPAAKPAVALLAGDPSSALERELVSLAERWGRGVAGQQFEVSPPGERLTDTVSRVLAAHDGPLLVIWPCLSRWRPEHLTGPLTDLAAGCDLVLGPTMDAGVYLVAVSRLIPGLLEQFEAPLRDDAVVIGARAAQEDGIEIGLLRVERSLRSPADVEAALVDPLTPSEILARLES